MAQLRQRGVAALACRPARSAIGPRRTSDERTASPRAASARGAPGARARSRRRATAVMAARPRGLPLGESLGEALLEAPASSAARAPAHPRAARARTRPRALGLAGQCRLELEHPTFSAPAAPPPGKLMTFMRPPALSRSAQRSRSARERAVQSRAGVGLADAERARQLAVGELAVELQQHELALAQRQRRERIANGRAPLESLSASPALRLADGCPRRAAAAVCADELAAHRARRCARSRTATRAGSRGGGPAACASGTGARKQAL